MPTWHTSHGGTQLEIKIKYTLVYIVRGEQAFKRHTQGLQSADGDKGTRGLRDRSSTIREQIVTERERFVRIAYWKKVEITIAAKCQVNEIIEHC